MVAPWHILDILGNPDLKNGYLETVHHKGGNGEGYDPANQLKQGVAAEQHILSTFPSTEKAKAAAECLKGVHCAK